MVKYFRKFSKYFVCTKEFCFYICKIYGDWWMTLNTLYQKSKNKCQYLVLFTKGLYFFCLPKCRYMLMIFFLYLIPSPYRWSAKRRWPVKYKTWRNFRYESPPRRRRVSNNFLFLSYCVVLSWKKEKKKIILV